MKHLLLALLLFSVQVTAQTEWLFCSEEGETCYFEGTQEIRYGAEVDGVGYWVFQTHTDSVNCNNSTFGDPIYLTFKACYTAVTDPEPDPDPEPVYQSGTIDWRNCYGENWTDGDIPNGGTIKTCNDGYEMVDIDCRGSWCAWNADGDIEINNDVRGSMKCCAVHE